MVAYSFKARFAPKILDGSKDQTIRLPRANGHAEPGSALQLYVGMRTRQCRLIARTTCLSLHRCRLVFWPVIEIEVDREKLRGDELDEFARRDGFSDLKDMAQFWSSTHDLHGSSKARAHVFEGVIVRWAPLQEEPTP